MSHLAPPLRDAKAAVLTTTGWIHGTFRIPTNRNIVDFVNQHLDYFKMVDVRLPGIEAPVPFFALQRQSVILLLPEEPEELLRIPTLGGDRVEREVSCLFANGMASGSLFVPHHARVSDFLMQRQIFFHLRDCTLATREGDGHEERRSVPIIAINSTRIVGVSEPRID